MSKTWLVFEDGSYYSVDCSLHSAPKGNPKPVDAYLFTEPEGDFTIAARKAVHAVFTCAEKRGLYKNSGPVIAGFDLSERTRLDTSITGQSGGLCFAACFAKKLLKTDPGNIAATGVVEADGRIGKVKGIETKLKTAANLIKEEGIILYPEKNLIDISYDLKNLLKKKKIKSFPVADMQQVFDILFKNGGDLFYKKPLFKKSILFLLLMPIAGVIAMAIWIYFYDNTKKTSLPVKGEKQTVPIANKDEILDSKEVKKLIPEIDDITSFPTDDTEQPNNRKSGSFDDKGFE